MVAAALVLLVGSTPAHGTRAAAPPEPTDLSPTPPAARPADADAASRESSTRALGAVSATGQETLDAPPVELEPFDQPLVDLPVAAGATLASTPPTSTVRAAETTARKKKPERIVSAARRPSAMWAQLRRGFTVTGLATWYGSTSGYTGAHVAMAGARYVPAGRTAPRVRVCAAGRCAVLPVVDYCACRSATSRPRLVDLSAGALRRLGLDPSRGVYEVRVTLVSG